MLTSSYKTEHINLVEYCTNIANIDGTFVTCIQADQDWYTKGHKEGKKLKDTQSAAIVKDLVL